MRRQNRDTQPQIKISSRSKRHKKHAKARQAPLETLADELLLNVLEHVESKQDLLSMCLVSHRLYNLTIEVLYRDLSLDLSAASHRRLLRRLVHPKASLPQRIQTLRMDTSWQDLSFQHCHNIYTLFYLMTNLKFFTWTGPLDALSKIPGIFQARFPKAIMEVKDNDFCIFGPDSEDDSDFEFDLEDDRDTGNATMITLLTHPVQSQITQITLFLSNHSSEVCASFKKDLVGFLSNNRVLRLISIRLRDYVSVSSHVAAFETGELPQPTVLDLGNTSTAVFTPEELKAWGKRGGWQRLTSLATGSTDCFRSFVGCGVALEKLVLYTTDVEDNDLETFDTIFDSANTPIPFPDLRSFSCVERHSDFRPDLRFMSVNILRWMPKLTHLLLTHDMNRWIPGSLEQELPTPQHVRDIRQTCPDLENLTIEMGMMDDRPSELIHELARFSKPIKLNLFILRPVDRQVRVRLRNYWRIAREVYHERKRLGLMWGRPSAVTFTTVHQYDWIPLEKVDSPDICFENFRTRLGELTVPQFDEDKTRAGASRTLDRMTDGQLKIAQFKTVFGYPVRKRKRIVQEIKRRKEDEHTVLGPDDYPTLYDAMMQRDD